MTFIKAPNREKTINCLGDKPFKELGSAKNQQHANKASMGDSADIQDKTNTSADKWASLVKAEPTNKPRTPDHPKINTAIMRMPAGRNIQLTRGLNSK